MISDQTLAHLRNVVDWPDLGARYEVKGRLGRGGMGAVYGAYDRHLEREVAVKVLDRPAEASSLPDEAKILARLEHPGIVPVHDAGRAADGRVFYVMKLVRGARLHDALDAQGSSAQRLDLFLRICDAVAFAHAHGVVHRDLKPENIMLGPFGEVLVMDWGVASLLAGAPESAGLIVGTPGYMAPEQAAGEARIDGRADVFALGALLTAMAPNPIARPLAAIAQHARETRPEDRYATVEALAKDVAAFRDGESVTAYRETMLERLTRICRRYRVPILLVLAYMIMRVILLLWFRV